ncbi:MAG: hypothetical protein OHK93_006293 [Ramalina farinacea]|uniref:Uncharacterized protein n=1 Tax=Ramalina farinacea TaxID=258253 RepID=A0AA43QIA4_9LECA|nr:hypothetical protein [Ramalina farinacea]
MAPKASRLPTAKLTVEVLAPLDGAWLGGLTGTPVADDAPPLGTPIPEVTPPAVGKGALPVPAGRVKFEEGAAPPGPPLGTMTGLLPVETGAVVKGTVTEVGVTVGVIDGVIDGVMEAVVVLGALLEVSGIATAVEKVEMSE